jgi:acetyl-CoA acetyltransferase
MTESAIIVGAGETPVGRFPGRTTLDLQAEAVQRALADAGIGKDRVDAVYALGSYIRPIQMHGLSLTEYLGIKPAFTGNFDVGGTVAFMTMIENAVSAVRQGRIEVAVCVYGDNTATHRSSGVHGFVPLIEQGTELFEDPFGSSIVASYALLARRYLELNKLDPEAAFAPIAIAHRAHAALNENAINRKPLTIDDYRASPWIAEPFRKADCSPVVDAAGAFVVANRRILKETGDRRPGVSVLGFGTQVTHKIVSQTPDIGELGMAEAGKKAFAEAGLGPADVDLLTVHDGFTASVSITAEALGFVAPGETGSASAKGELSLGGRLPVNTHGGLLSQGHVGGILHVVEAIRQLRGEAGARQIPDAEIAAVSGNGNIFSICGLMLLGKGT